MTDLVIGVLALTACVYGTSSLVKLVSRTSYRAFRDGLAETKLVPRRLLGGVAVALTSGEAVVAVLLAVGTVLAVTNAPGSVPVAAAALGCGSVLGAVLAAGVAVVIRSGTRATCACFGARASRPIGPSHLARNAFLLVLMIVGLIGNSVRHGKPDTGVAIVAIAAGAVIALLIIRLDDLADLFAPVHREAGR